MRSAKTFSINSKRNNDMNMRIIYIMIIVTALLSSGTGISADERNSEKSISKIKVDDHFICAENTAVSADEARRIADEILVANIKSWVAVKRKMGKSTDIAVCNKRYIQTVLETPNGLLYTVFVYVSKNDVFTGKGIEIIGSTQSRPQAGSFMGLPKVDVAPNISKDIIEETPKGRDVGNALDSIGGESHSTTWKRTYPDVVKDIASYRHYDQIVEHLKELKEKGEISHYGRYASLGKTELYYLAIYNTAGKVVAILSPGDVRYNVATGEEDGVTNYGGCGALGFMLATK